MEAAEASSLIMAEDSVTGLKMSAAFSTTGEAATTVGVDEEPTLMPGMFQTLITADVTAAAGIEPELELDVIETLGVTDTAVVVEVILGWDWK